MAVKRMVHYTVTFLMSMAMVGFSCLAEMACKKRVDVEESRSSGIDVAKLSAMPKQE